MSATTNNDLHLSNKTTIQHKNEPAKDNALSCHECSTIIPITEQSIEQHLQDELLQSAFQWMFWSPHHLVKDDVFFAPPTTSAMTTTCMIDSTVNNIDNNHWVPTPCLSPVTSPSDFLYDREPLFDGIYQEDEPDEYTTTAAEDNHVFFSTLHSPILASADNDELLDLCNNKYYDILPLTPSSTEEEEEGESVDDDSNSYNETQQLGDDQDDEFSFEYNLDDQDDINYRYNLNIVNKFQVMNHTASSKKQQNPLKRKVIDESMLLYMPVRTTKKSKVISSSVCTTVFENLTKLGIDWCRYCGTTEGVNWRPGPWGKRTLCNKHGCDYKGYGLASRLPRLDLSAFSDENVEDRQRPVVQQFCIICQSPEKDKSNVLIACEGGCSRAYHQYCNSDLATPKSKWYCGSSCKENKQKNKVGTVSAIFLFHVVLYLN